MVETGEGWHHTPWICKQHSGLFTCLLPVFCLSGHPVPFCTTCLMVDMVWGTARNGFVVCWWVVGRLRLTLRALAPYRAKGDFPNPQYFRRAAQCVGPSLCFPAYLEGIPLPHASS
jgi:hypothetical protein